MPRIQQLSASVVNKIAAGEVIERPASVVKELVENSLDAGATRIDVSLEQGGTESIRVVDNGAGIAAEELPLAVASHATSKLATADDLFRVRTLGFRGEALASIAEVSRFSLRSRTVESESGAELEVVAGVLSPIAPCGCPQGTTIEVRNLFFNTPVRRKFLRSTQTEMGHTGETFTRLALAYPRVHFTLRQNGRTIHDLPPEADCRARISRFFGQDLAERLLAVESRDGAIALSGYVAEPSQSRANARMQYLFLNGRSIRDRSLQHALGEAYRGLLLTGRYPITFLHFDMPPELVDVNVHPTKLEVRFQDGGRLYSQLLGTLRTKFLTTDLTHRVAPTPAEPDADIVHDPARAAEIRRELVDWAKQQVAALGVPLPVPKLASATEGAAVFPSQAHAPLEIATLARRWEPVGLPEDDDEEPKGEASPAAPGARAETFGPVETFARAGRAPSPALQIHNRYLVTETDEGVLVIDQHALHERILYEQLRAKALAGVLETQPLLVPEPVDLSSTESAAALEHRELLAQLGIRVEPFGGDTVLVSSHPAMLSGVSPVELFRDLVERLVAGGKLPERRDVLDELLHMMSCKAAIKAGDRLTDGEVAALVEQRHLAQDSHHCPHGRPTALVFTREELDRQFMRT